MAKVTFGNRQTGTLCNPDVWGEVEFVDAQGYTERAKLTQAMFERLDAAQVVTEAATTDHVRLLRHH